MKRKLRMGMVGGSAQAFIGAVHRKAAAMDGEIELVCGAFSDDAARSKATGESLYLDPRRVYASYVHMMHAERSLPSDQRMDFVAIVTPNHLHHDPARLALQNGFHVFVDKPMTFSIAQAHELRALVDKTGLVFAVTYTYSGYPLVKEARALVLRGELGAVRKVYVEYTQGWLSTALENTGHRQAVWRTDPARSGAGGVIGDSGTHAAHLAEYATALQVKGWLSQGPNRRVEPLMCKLVKRRRA
jgi:predicted dehydrogenase